MAHEVENMFYTGDVPWHGLGRYLPEAPSIEEAIVASGLNWEVGLKDLFLDDGRKVTHKATFRKSDSSVLGVVGPRYQPLQNIEVFNFFKPFLEANECSLHTAGSLKDGKKVWVLAKINRDNMEILKGDELIKFLLVSNAHDGTSAIRVVLTPIRVVCANTLAMTYGMDSKVISLKHTSGAVDTLEEVQNIINLANAEFEATAEQMRMLARRQISEAQIKKYVKQVFSIQEPVIPEDATEEQVAEIVSLDNHRVVNRILELHETGRGTDIKGVKGTIWGAYNAVTEYLNHEKNASQDVRLNSLWLGDGFLKNKKALSEAIKLAA